MYAVIIVTIVFDSDIELSHLTEKFNIPNHIAIVMSLASEKDELPQYTKRWPFSKSVHPSVLKALFFAK